MNKIRNVTRARDVRTERQLHEVQQQSDEPPIHASTHEGGTDPISPGGIGAETPAGAQSKADEVESNAKDYTDTSSQPRQGGTTANRPSSPDNYEFYFDTDLNKPIWWNGSNWVDATGTTV
jgi:hypothetical protein